MKILSLFSTKMALIWLGSYTTISSKDEFLDKHDRHYVVVVDFYSASHVGTKKETMRC